MLGLPQPDGSMELLVGQMNYEAATTDAASVLSISIASNGRRPRQPRVAIAGATSTTGPLAAADYDGDGDLDLFVGGRVLPGRYPTAPSSRLFTNDGGTLRLDEANSETLAGIGMVSAAVFSDIDGDGDPDLVLALEWGPLVLLANNDGRFLDVTELWGLASFRSRWNGVTTGDLDGDGRLDIIATSWGLNTPYRVGDDRPLLLYYGDFDGNGLLDLIHAQRRGRWGDPFPLETLRELRVGIPSVGTRMPTFAAYADATVRDLVGPRLDESMKLEITTLAHMVFFNRGSRFEAVALPAEAQLAPAFYAGVADFDGDGHEDVFLTQNFFPTKLETPRYDAGRGLWLKGDGTGQLTPVPGRVSGIEVYGDQRGAALADYNADGRVDLVISQNGAATKLYRNQGAQPGLRVRLVGPPSNPNGIGAAMRLVYADHRGPVREIHAGSGYWSQDGAVQVLGLAATPIAVWVRWPSGKETEVPVEAGAREIVVRQ